MAKRNTNGFGLISRVGPRSKELEYQLRRSAHVANIGTIRIKSDWCLSEAEAFESWSMKRDKRISDHTSGFTKNSLVVDIADHIAAQTSRAGEAYALNTIRNHRTWANTLRRYIPKLQLKDVTLETFMQLRIELEKPIKTPTYSWSGRSSVVPMTMWIFREAMDHAYRYDLIARHPLQKMDPATKKQIFKNNRLSVQEHKYLAYTHDEVELILGSADQDARQKFYQNLPIRAHKKYYDNTKHDMCVYQNRMLFIVAEMGLRVGEICALQWKHIRWGDKSKDQIGYIVIEQQYTCAYKPGEIKLPKSLHGIRVHPMSWECQEMLLKHKAQWIEDRLLSPMPFNWPENALAKKWRLARNLEAGGDLDGVPAEGAVFPNILGNFNVPESVQMRLRDLSKKLGIYRERRSIHGFRRKVAAETLPYLHQENLAKLLGHSPLSKAISYEYGSFSDNEELNIQTFESWESAQIKIREKRAAD